MRVLSYLIMACLIGCVVVPKPKANAQDKEQKLSGRSQDKAAKDKHVAASSVAAASAGPDEEDPLSQGPARPIVSALLPDFFTGAMSLQLPIEVGPGRAGIQPKVNLVYRSFGGNGWLGQGWTLSVGDIRRDTLFGLDFAGDNFALVLNDAQQQLVSVGSREYSTKVMENFYRIKRLPGADGKDYWELIDKRGIRYLFGRSSVTRQDDPSYPKNIVKWSLDHVEDPNGNYVDYSYKKDSGEIYLDRISYTGAKDQLPTQVVAFELERRDDVDDNYAFGFLVNTKFRLKRVTVDSGTALTRRYELSYSYSPTTSTSLLSQVTQFGSDGQSALPASKFQYQGQGGGWIQSGWGGTPPADPIVRRSCLKGDFNGDGKSDLSCPSGGNLWTVALSTGSTWAVSSWGGGPALKTNLQDQCLTGDFNGDGQSDLACYMRDGIHPDYWHVALSNGRGWEVGCPTKCWSGGPQPGISAQQNCIVGDFNGDGKSDIACVSDPNQPTMWSIGLSYGYGFSANRWSGPSAGALYLRQDCFTGDFNGDGKTDIACQDPFFKDRWSIGISTGKGFDVIPFKLPSFSGVDNNCVIGDFNGDGKDDLACYGMLPGFPKPRWWLIFLNGHQFTVKDWGVVANIRGSFCEAGEFNGDHKTDLGCYTFDPNGHVTGAVVLLSTGHGWNVVPSGGTTVAVFKNPSCFIGDFDGDGKTDAACYSAPNGWQVGHTQGEAPDLLKQYDTSLGGHYSIQYAFSSLDAYTSRHLPVPVNVVSRLKADDGRGVVSTRELKYASGYYDSLTREFRGFAHTTLIESLEAGTDSGIRDYWFHQGIKQGIMTYDPSGLTGRLLRFRLTQGDGVPLREATVEYALNQGVAPYFNPPAKLDLFTCDQSGCAGKKHVQATYTFDEHYGNLIRETFQDFGDTAQDKTITWSYLEDEPDWIVGLPQTISYYQGIIHPRKLKSTAFSYDDVDATCQSVSILAIKGNKTRVTQWFEEDETQSPTSLTGYDTYGNAVCERDPKGNLTRFGYDRSGTFATSQTNSLGHVSLFKFFGVDNVSTDRGQYGQLKEATDPNHANTTFEYDAFGRRAKAVYPDSSWVTYSYNNLGDPHTQHILDQTSGGLSTWSYFDGYGREWRSKRTGADNTVILVDQQYGPVGLVSQYSYPYFENKEKPSWVALSYDALGRVRDVREPSGYEVSACYRDWDAFWVDENSHLHRTAQDSFGHITKVEEFLGTFSRSCTLPAPTTPYATTKYSYNVLGNLTQILDAKSNQTSLEYDSLQRLRRVKDPDLGINQYIYDLDGQLVKEINARGQTFILQYDGLGRLVQKNYDGAKQLRERELLYRYDEGTNGIGRLSSVRDNSGQTIYHYDIVGRLTEELKTVHGRPFTTNTAYDALGRVVTLTNPNKSHLDYSYNGPFLGQVSVNGRLLLASTEYTADGQPRAEKYGNGVVTSYTFYEPSNTACSIDSRRVCTMTAQFPNGQSQGFGYVYDPKGNVQSVQETNGLVVFAYDELDRLTGSKEVGHTGNAGVGSTSVSFDYDKIGNIKRNSLVGDYVYSANGTRPHAVLTAGTESFQYDSSGNMVKAGNKELVVDPENRVVMVKFRKDHGGLWSFIYQKQFKMEMLYDWKGSRVYKKESRLLPFGIGGLFPKKTYYPSDQFECRGHECLSHLFLNTRVVSTFEGDGKKEAIYYHRDSTQSTRFLTNSKGAIVQSFAYLPFGDTEKTEGLKGHKDDYRFAGQLLDQESGFYYSKARYYEPQIGRFTSPDTIAARLARPQSLNRFSYVLNNPTTFYDPSGHDEDGGDDGGGGTTVGHIGDTGGSSGSGGGGGHDHDIVHDAPDRGSREGKQTNTETTHAQVERTVSGGFHGDPDSGKIDVDPLSPIDLIVGFFGPGAFSSVASKFGFGAASGAAKAGAVRVGEGIVSSTIEASGVGLAEGTALTNAIAKGASSDAASWLTQHGTQRLVERGISTEAIQTAINTAVQTGKVAVKVGKYGTPQVHFAGANGITVVVETAGSNAGKIITILIGNK